MWPTYDAPNGLSPSRRDRMDEDRFWEIVDAARAESVDEVDERPAALEGILMALAPAEVKGFQERYDEALRRANLWSLRGAAALMNGGDSDDGFRAFLDWLISEGRPVYEAALDDPDTLADLPDIEDFGLEDYGYVAADVYQELTGDELEPAEPAVAAERADSEAPAGEEWDEEQLAAMFPRLAQKYGEEELDD
jgi:hypothetical protein